MPRRYVLALAVIAVLFFLGIWLLISLITGGDSVETTQESGETIESAKELTSDTNSVSYTVYGPVVGEEQRRAIRIVVTANERRAEVLRGYYETVIKDEVIPNNPAAFDALVIALDGVGFDEFNKNNKTDEFSVCTTGQRVVYETKFDNDETIRSWSTSCGNRQGSFLGDSYLVQTLMQKQIPNYLDFASGVQIY